MLVKAGQHGEGAASVSTGPRCACTHILTFPNRQALPTILSSASLLQEAVLRTTYVRYAYQRTDTAAVRVSLDMQVGLAATSMGSLSLSLC